MKFSFYFLIFYSLSSTFEKMQSFFGFNQTQTFSQLELEIGTNYLINESFLFTNDCIITGNNNIVSFQTPSLGFDTMLLTLSKAVNVSFTNISFQLSEYTGQIIFFIEENSLLIFQDCFIESNENVPFNFVNSIDISTIIMRRLFFFNNTVTLSNFINSNFSNIFILDSIFINNAIFNNFISFSFGFLQISNTLIINNKLWNQSFISIQNNDETNSIDILMENCYLYSNIFETFINVSALSINKAVFSNIFIESNTFFQSILVILTLTSNLITFQNFVLIQNLYLDYLMSFECAPVQPNPFHIDNFIAAYGNEDKTPGKSIFKFVGPFEVTINILYILNHYSFNEVCGFRIFEYQETLNMILSFYINASLIQNNEADYDRYSNYGGVVIFFQKSDNFYIFFSYFINNSISGIIEQNSDQFSGGPCFINTKRLNELYILNSTFLDNNAAASSSCINFIGESFTIQESIFQGNGIEASASEINSNSYGALLFDSLNTFFLNSTFFNNYGYTSAVFGILTSLEKVYIDIENVQIINNSAVLTILYFEISDYFISVIGTNILDNISKEQFLVMNNMGEEIENHIFIFLGLIYYNNTSTNGIELVNVGARYNFSSSFFGKVTGILIHILGEITLICVFENTLFIQCLGIENPIFFIELGYLALNNCKILENVAFNYGLMVIDSYSEVLLNGCILSSTLTQESVIKIIGRAKFNSINTNFTNNTIFISGLISVFLLANVSIENCSFSDNIGYHDGSLLLIMNCFFPIRLSECLLGNNSSPFKLIMITSAELQMTNTVFFNNEGEMFLLIYSNLTLNTFQLNKHTCKNFDSACFLSILVNSTTKIFNLTINNIQTLSKMELITLKVSNLVLNNIWIQYITNSVLSALNSNLQIQNFILTNFTETVFLLSRSSIIISDSLLISNNCENVRAIESSYNDIIIQYSQFNNFLLKNGNGAVILASSTTIEIIHCKFFGSMAFKGGVISFYNSTANIYSSVFIENKAEFGGSIYFQGQEQTSIDWNLSNNSFISNIAFSAGGAYYWEYNKPKESSELPNVFINNSALTGNNYSSQPLKLNFANFSEEFVKIINNYIPSQEIDYPIIMNLFDYYNQQILYNLNGKCFLERFQPNIIYFSNYSDTKYSYFEYVTKTKDIGLNIYGDIVNDFMNYTCAFNKIKVYAPSNYVFLISIRTDLIKPVIPNVFDDEYPFYFYDGQDFSYLLSFNITECPIGYIRNLETFQCLQCSVGTYSLNIQDEYCEICPENAFCDSNGSFINVDSGYWRSNYFSNNIYQCYMSAACQGGDMCSQGYEGILCDTCTTNNNNKYYKSNGLKCVQCDEATLSFVFLAIVVLAVVIYMIYNIRVNIIALEFEGLNNKINVVGVFFKIFADYIQILSCLTNLPLNYPGNFQTFFSLISNVTNLVAILYPLDCVLGNFLNGITLFLKKLIMVLIFGALIPIVCLLFWNIYAIIKKNMSKFSKQKKIWISIIVLCYNFQPSLITTLFTFQNCVQIDGNLRLKKNVNVICWEGSHLLYFYFLVMPNLLLWMIFLPGFLLYVLIKSFKTKQTKNSHNSIKLSVMSVSSPLQHFSVIESTNIFKFCTEGFKEKTYFWEFILLIRKYCIIVLSIFPFSDNMITNILIIWFVILLFLILQILISPYESKHLNMLALFYNLTLYFTVLSMIFLSFSTTVISKIYSIIPVITANLAFCLFCITFIFIYKKGIIKAKLKQLNGYILAIRNSTVLATRNLKSHSFLKSPKKITPR